MGLREQRKNQTALRLERQYPVVCAVLLEHKFGNWCPFRVGRSSILWLLSPGLHPDSELWSHSRQQPQLDRHSRAIPSSGRFQSLQELSTQRKVEAPAPFGNFQYLQPPVILGWGLQRYQPV